MKKKVLISALGVMLALVGCGAASENEVGLQQEPIPVEEAVQDATEIAIESAIETPTDSTATRKDGERFEDVIILEGMEEPVNYEHAVNDVLGIEIDCQ